MGGSALRERVGAGPGRAVESGTHLRVQPGELLRRGGHTADSLPAACRELLVSLGEGARGGARGGRAGGAAGGGGAGAGHVPGGNWWWAFIRGLMGE